MATRVYAPVCSVKDCDREHYALGFCQPHHRRFVKRGDPVADVPISCLIHDRATMVPPSCSIKGCVRVRVAKGLCGAHYARTLAHGDPRADVPIKDYAERVVPRPVYSRVLDVSTRVGECLRHPSGPRGQVTIRLAKGEHRAVGVRRALWETIHGEIPCNLRVYAACSNGDWCIEPSHLALGTEQTIMAVRGGVRVGDQNGRTRLTADDVAAARRRHRAGETLTALGKEIGVHPSTLSVAVRGLTWKEVTEPPVPASVRVWPPLAELVERVTASSFDDVALELGVGSSTLRAHVRHEKFRQSEWADAKPPTSAGRPDRQRPPSKPARPQDEPPAKRESRTMGVLRRVAALRSVIRR